MDSKSNEVGQELLSFGFDTELLSCFWSVSDRRPLNNPLPVPVPPKIVSPVTLFQILVPPTRAESNFVTWLQYSVVTSGVLVVVGLGSYCTYQCLRNMRQKLLDSKYLKNSPPIDLPVGDEDEISRIEAHNLADGSVTGAMQLVPAELKVCAGALPNLQLRLNTERGSDCIGLRLSASAQSFGRSIFEDDSDSDLEDAEIEAKYFGPVSGGGAESDAELLSDDPDAEELLALEEPPPVSPTDSAYTSEYETLPRPGHLHFPDDDV